MVNNNLRSLREAQGLSIREMASRMKANRGRLSEYENGLRNPDRETLEKFKKFYGEEVRFWIETEVHP